MSKYLEGLQLNLEDGWELTVNSYENCIEFSKYNIKNISIKYEQRYCGCCEGDDHYETITLEELFDVISNKKTNRDLQETIERLTKEVKTQKELIKTTSKQLSNLKKTINIVQKIPTQLGFDTLNDVSEDVAKAMEKNYGPEWRMHNCLSFTCNYKCPRHLNDPNAFSNKIIDEDKNDKPN